MPFQRHVLGVLFFLTTLLAQAQPAVPFHRGVNLTGWFQADRLHSIAFSMFGPQDFRELVGLGVDVVRLPISFSTLVGPAPDYRFDPLLFSLLDQALDDLTAAGLKVVVDNHSDFVKRDHEAFLTALWTQFASHNRGRPASIMYEIQNEPHDITGKDWDRIQRRVLAAIRTVDAQRTIVVSGADWGGVTGLLALPEYSDPGLIYSFHFYDPFLFTHQGASWAGLEGLRGISFPPNPQIQPQLTTPPLAGWVPAAVRDYQTQDPLPLLKSSLDAAQEFSARRGVPIWCGEFGVYNKYALPEDRVAWYGVVRGLFEERNIPWTMWDYKGSFGLFQPNTAEEFERHLNLPQVAALGFRVPAQSPPGPRVISQSVVLFDDQVGRGLRVSNWDPEGRIDFFDGDDPHQGRFSLRIRGIPRYGSVALGMDWDLTPISETGAVAFWVRTTAKGVNFDVRFVNQVVDGPDGLPWRRTFTVDNKLFASDGRWHRIEIPFSRMKESGAWNGSWHEPIPGSFDWARVGSFEIVAENLDLTGMVLGFDDLRILEAPSERP